MSQIRPTLLQIDGLLGQVERLARQLRADPDEAVHRSAVELRAAFDGRRAVEPAMDRMRASVRKLRRAPGEGSARELHPPATGLDRLDDLLEQELLPHLRRVGFEV